MKRVVCTLVLTLTGLVIGSPSLQAQSPYLGGSCCGGQGGYLGGFGMIGSPYALGAIPTPPYFALHPPVYYSQPVPRTYGYSPFAYPGTKETPEIVMQSAKMMVNPHVTPTTKKRTTFDSNLTAQVQSQAEIVNPFVQATSTHVVTLQD